VLSSFNFKTIIALIYILLIQYLLTFFCVSQSGGCLCSNLSLYVSQSGGFFCSNLSLFAQGTDSGVDTYFGFCTYPGQELRHRIDLKVTYSIVYTFLYSKFKKKKNLRRMSDDD